MCLLRRTAQAVPNAVQNGFDELEWQTVSLCFNVSESEITNHGWKCMIIHAPELPYGDPRQPYL